MMLGSYEELDYVRDHIAPRLEKGLLDRGFVVLNWGDAGWVHFFTKQPAMHPDEIRKMKLCVLQGDTGMMGVIKRMGFIRSDWPRPTSSGLADWPGGRDSGASVNRAREPMVRRGEEHAGHQIRATGRRDVISKDVWEKIPPMSKSRCWNRAQGRRRAREEIRKRKRAPSR